MRTNTSKANSYNFYQSSIRGPGDVFFARLGNAKILLHLLKSLNFKESVTFLARASGLKISAEVSRACQTNAFLQKDAFQEYHVKDDDDDLTFDICLDTLIQCLNISGTWGQGGTIGTSAINAATTMGPTQALVLSHDDCSQQLKLLLEEDGVVTEAYIPTTEESQNLEFYSFDQPSSIMARIIVTSDCLKDVFHELDTDNESVEVRVTPGASGCISFAAVNSTANFTASVPLKSEMVNMFEVDEERVANYPLSILRHGLKPISLSEKISIRIDNRDFLCLQYMIKSQISNTCFIEFYCAPEENMNGSF